MGKRLQWCASIFMGICVACSASAQEGLGAALDNYAPVNGMMLNPSAIVDQRPWLDIHIGGVSAHASNNVTYINDSRLVNLSRLDDPSFNTNRGNGWGQMDADVLGPSASLSMGDYAFGFHTAVRYVGNAKNIPVAYGQKYLEQPITVTDSIYNLEKSRLKTMAWAEIGISYGQVLYRFDRHFITGGVTVNRLMGIQSSSLFIKEGNLGTAGQSVSANQLEGKYAQAGPKFSVGGGWSGSIGITYKRMVNDASNYVPHSPNAFCATLPYRFKIMASIIDVGAIRFKRNSIYNKLDGGDADAFVQNVTASGVSNAGSVPREGSRYTAITPMAANIQYDHNFNKGWFLNGFLLQRLSPSSTYGPERANLLAITPRYEKKQFTLSVPVSLVNYKKPQLGLAFRLAFFTVGTEHILPFLFQSDIYSADVYFHLRINLFHPPNCLEKPGGKEESFWLFNIFRKKENDPTACPEW